MVFSSLFQWALTKCEVFLFLSVTSNTGPQKALAKRKATGNIKERALFSAAESSQNFLPAILPTTAARSNRVRRYRYPFWWFGRETCSQKERLPYPHWLVKSLHTVKKKKKARTLLTAEPQNWAIWRYCRQSQWLHWSYVKYSLLKIYFLPETPFSVTDCNTRGLRSAV